MSTQRQSRPRRAGRQIGSAIIDHKSDALSDANARFTHHWPQLDACRRAVELVQSERPVKRLGVHWTHLGAVTFTSTQ